MLNEKILKNEECAVYKLRSLYNRFGYTCFKMSKFEEYDLYVRNKDFLISDGIITFTDTNGKLLALKPDVTLSIIKNSTDASGAVQKLYYDENVYRIAGGTGSFKEITQTGLECIGDIGNYEVCEVLTLALKSLETIDSDYIMDVSHAGLVASVLDALDLTEDVREKVSAAIKQKSRDVVETMYNEGKLPQKAFETVNKLIDNYRDSAPLKAVLSGISQNADTALVEFCDAIDTIVLLGFGEKINVDFSIVNDLSYYSGVVFKGYIKGIPTEVLSGGRYDKLMKKMGKQAGAVGFAVYLDVLERHNFKESEYDYDFVLLTDDKTDTATIIKKVEELSKDGSSVAVFKKECENVRCRKVVKL